MEGVSVSVKAGGIGWPSVKGRVAAAGMGARSTITPPPHHQKKKRTLWSFTEPLRCLWTNRKQNDGVADKIEEQIEEEMEERSWVLKIMQVRSLWKGEEAEQQEDNAESGGGGGCSECSVEEENVKFDRDSFSRLLKRVSLADAKLYARISHLANLAYSIPKIKSDNLLKTRGLQYVTSSLDKKALTNSGQSGDVEDTIQQVNTGTSRTSAYNIAASAASYLQSRTTSILSSKSRTDETEADLEVTTSDLASFVATTSSMTAVVASKEENKQAVAKELNSATTSPCEWYICDDDQTKTRFFVVQGSESLASWQANLLFEPIQFEGLDVPVHRGIYEAAKGIYEQMLPEVHSHLKAHGKSATFRFTGHSLGGSLSLLVHLMLLIRGEVPPSSLLPVIMFGAPFVMCGGDQLLRRLGLPRSHVQAITMHRDIVPRAFSCSYPDHVVELLKAVNGNFRNHRCLCNQKLLYTPMGDILILQPEEKFSPHHDLLPSGSGLYLLSCPLSESTYPDKQLQAAKTVFFNTPHPLEVLSDRSAYGSDGTIYKDHDMQSYLKSVLDVIRLELNQIRKINRKQRRQVWWPRIIPQSIQAGTAVGKQDENQSLPTHFRIFHNGTESLKRFSQLVAQHMHFLVLLLVPARLMVFGTFAITRFL